ncbi:MAG: Gfo/Idh/MocA family oxidoreductase [Candidatus Aenigmarchaeota archaeon]|nr:Gfo/Idh/MocA family oxidoreductase [Candidatus Aenigmarchaeota archaeon]
MDEGAAGVIGAGFWGKKHIEEYIKLGLEVYAADVSKESLQKCRELYPVKGIYADYKELLQNKEIRYVSVCTPNSTHFQVASDSARAGKNTLVEKPFVLKSEEGQGLIRLANERKLHLSVGHIFRFNNAVNFIRNSFIKGDIGTPYLLKLNWSNLEPIYADRDVIFDLAPHPFDIVNYIFNALPDEISCVGGSYRQQKHAEAAFIICRLNSTLVNIEVSWLTPRKQREVVFVGSRKTIFADCARQKVSVYDNEQNSYYDVDIIPNNTLQDELREFIRCSESRGFSVADAEVGLKIVRLLEISEESMKKKKMIHYS